MSIALLATGNEIITGDTLNTNAQQIAHLLHSEQLAIGNHLSCSDDQADILNCIQFLAQHHNTIIITGGLGPTSDDRTRFALAEFMGESLITHQKALEHLESFFQRTIRPNENNLQQALFPNTAYLLDNPNGTAMGCYCYKDKCLLVLLPGPPRECLPMFNSNILPLLNKDKQSSLTLLKWRLFGVSESEIGEQLEHLLQNIDCMTGYRLDTPYLEFKIQCHMSLATQIQQIISPVVQPFIITPTTQKASQQLIDLIIDKNLSCTINDNASGGILETLLHLPKTAHLIHFNTTTTHEINVHAEGINDYWQQKTRGGLTNLNVHIKSRDKEQQTEKLFTNRSNSIVHSAAEWICYCMIEFINNNWIHIKS